MLTFAQAVVARTIRNDSRHHILHISSGKIKLQVDYNKRCVLDSLWIGRRMVLDKSLGGFTGLLIDSTWATSRTLASVPKVNVSDSAARITDISYGTSRQPILESWTFSFEGDDVIWRIDRDISKPIRVDDDAFPALNIRSINQFEGALLGNGGVAWFKLFNDSAVAYGVHTQLATFWNTELPECLQLSSQTPSRHGAVKFYRAGDRLGCAFTCSPAELTYRHDPGTNRRRFIRGGTDVWKPTTYTAGTYHQVLRISAPSYAKTLGRGTFRGIDGEAVTSILNTVARLGVIDSRLFGGNSWHTPYGPICLHEQYIGQFGIGIDDSNYVNGYKACLDYYRDHAVEPDGRVKARWAYTNEDASPGSADSLGFYEAQWGILLDSNPDFVINVADLFNQCGDLSWLRSQKQTCERALNYMLRRDLEHDSLVEVIPRTHDEHRGSDWLDVIWASWKDAFVNAELYHALTLWSRLEKLMGDTTSAAQYSGFAAGLKRRFNAPISEGGFWDPSHRWYVHWTEPDGSAWGNNLMTPVNFMAIDYGICDDPARKASILHAVDRQMEKEDLFFWPICMFPYEQGAGGPQNYPFPNYENGDLFLSWGELAVRAYAQEYPEIALRYIKLLIAKYKQDGLAFQRYLRTTQKGAGDDILAGNASAITGLYRDIYGIQPLYNRLYLNPHLVKELYGTTLRYQFQGSEYRVTLNGAENEITTGGLTLGSSEDFAVKRTANGVLWFKNKRSRPALRLTNEEAVRVSVLGWSHHRRWTEVALRQAATVFHEVMDLSPGKIYAVYRDGRMLMSGRAGADGHLQFACTVQPGNEELFEVRPATAFGGLDPSRVMSVSRPEIMPHDTLVFSPGAVFVKIDCATAGAVIRFTLDGTPPTDKSTCYVAPIKLTTTATVNARAWRRGLDESVVASSVIHFVPKDSIGVFRLGGKEVDCHKAFGARVQLKYPFSPQYPGSGANALTDGLLGTDRYQTNWQGFEENDLDATVDMGRMKSIDTVSVGFLQNHSLWIYYPVKVSIWVSTDGKKFIPLNSLAEADQVYGNGFSRRKYIASMGIIKCRYIRVHAVNIRTCPRGDPGAGGKAWLFVDEIVVE
jgi:Chitobiase/beta-hexosaminidase C-terminal domain/F5/8 type C domain